MYFTLSSLIGFITAWSVIIWGLLSSSSFWQVFVNPPSIIIVVAGTISTMFIGFRAIPIFKSLGYVFRLLFYQPLNIKKLREEILQVVTWSDRIQTGGKKVYDDISNSTNDPFIRYLFSILSTGYSEKDVRNFIEYNIEETYFSEIYEVEILKNLGASAPAFGMLGTLIGLIVLLSQLDDPSKIGSAMAIALVTTLYGIILARVLFLPAESKLSYITSVSRLRKQIILEGMILIMQEKSSFYIEDCLNSYLDQNLKQE